MDSERSDARHVCVTEYPRLVGALRLVCGHDGYLAEEFAQEALTRLCRDWDRVSEGSTRAWLYRVAVNLANSHWRRLAIRRRVEPQLIHTAGVPDHAGATAERIDMDRALARLSSREREVVVLRYFVDLSVKQTAEALGLTEQAVRSLSHRAVEKLRTVLSEEIVTVEVDHDL